MSNDLNRCEFIGRLGQDPEVRYTQNGMAIANISLAVGSSWKDKNTGEKVESTEWVRVTAFNKLAEIFGEYLEKGKQVYISGRMQTDKWEDKEGVTRYTTKIIADQMQMLGGKSDGSGSGKRKPVTAENTGKGSQVKSAPVDDFDDDIPF